MESTVTSKVAPRPLFSLISSPNIVLPTSVCQRSLEYKGKLKIFLKLPLSFLAPLALQFRYYPGQMSDWLKIIKYFKKYGIAVGCVAVEVRCAYVENMPQVLRHSLSWAWTRYLCWNRIFKYKCSGKNTNYGISSRSEQSYQCSPRNL